MDPQGLPSYLRELGRLLNRTRARAVIEVAQTARRETHSGLVLGLKESEGTHPKRKEYHEAPNRGETGDNEKDDEQHGDGERDVAKPSAPLLALRADIWNEGDG